MSHLSATRIYLTNFLLIPFSRILLHLRQAAGPDTKLLLADYILPLACVDEDIDATPHGDQSKKEILPGQVRTLAPEGSSLLPNLGKANANAYWLDLTVRIPFIQLEYNNSLRDVYAGVFPFWWIDACDV